jgi:hypothetical protein
VVFSAIILALLVLDLGVLHRKPHEVRAKEAAIWWAVPRSGRLLGEIVQTALADFPGLIQVLEGGGAVGAALVASGVDKIAFIGGGPTGRRVLQAAAERLTPVLLELGGNDAAIACHDADVERAAAGGRSARPILMNSQVLPQMVASRSQTRADRVTGAEYAAGPQVRVAGKPK